MLDKIKETILDIIAPKTCIGCEREGKYICDKCSLFLSEATSIFAQGNLREVISIWEYEGLIKKLILKIKYDGFFDIIDELVEKTFERRENYISEDVIITFVPMFEKKERQRGFNQAELIAKKVGQITGREVLPLLKKIKNTPSQTEMNKEERFKNVKDSFRIKEDVGHFDNILIVDDVWTSGATMMECARTLRKSGARIIRGFTLARII